MSAVSMPDSRIYSGQQPRTLHRPKRAATKPSTPPAMQSVRPPARVPCGVTPSMPHRRMSCAKVERQRESLCVLSALLGVATPKASGDRLKGPTTHTKGNVPEDFREAFAAYVAQDDQLYAEALELLDAHVEAFPRCKS